MNSSLKEQADALRYEATKKLCAMFGIGEGFSSGTVERIVECIVMAALMEMLAAQKEAALHIATGDNP